MYKIDLIRFHAESSFGHGTTELAILQKIERHTGTVSGMFVEVGKRGQRVL